MRKKNLLTAALLACLSPFAGEWLGEPRLAGVLLVLTGLAAVSGLQNIGVAAMTRELNFLSQFLMQVTPRLAIALRGYRALIAGMVVSRLLAVGMTYVASRHRHGSGLQGGSTSSDFRSGSVRSAGHVAAGPRGTLG